jgi:ribose transport system substrate-binding protein
MNKRGMRGVAVSPLDPVNQVEILDQVAAKMPLICHDSDAPNSKRLFYLGTNNYKAGREVGKLVKEAIPDGGEIMIFVGKMDVLNAQERRQGVIDELAGKPMSETPEIARKSDGLLRAGKWTILDTRTDQADETQAKQNAEDAINKYPNLKCMVGLWGYNPPACLAAVRDAGKLGEIAIVAFDEYDATLQAILDGEILATVVQQPFEFGYQSVKLLKALAEGDRSVIPEGGILDIPEKVIRKENAQEFWDELKALKASAE